MKTILSFLVFAVLFILNVHAGNSPSTPNSLPSFSKPTWGGDEHDQPVFTSPTNAPAITNRPATNLPTMTNWPATNSPIMTNPPTLQPPTGLSIVQ
jgi:hypothetical protein